MLGKIKKDFPESFTYDPSLDKDASEGILAMRLGVVLNHARRLAHSELRWLQAKSSMDDHQQKTLWPIISSIRQALSDACGTSIGTSVIDTDTQSMEGGTSSTEGGSARQLVPRTSDATLLHPVLVQLMFYASLHR